MSLIAPDERIEKAVAFCWETQRWLNTARFYAWHDVRIRNYVKSRTQLWRRFSSGVRTAAHQIFMEQLHEQLGKHPDERDTNKPVWVNEHTGIGLPSDSAAVGE